MATNEVQERWFSTAVGRATNPDGVAGFQCVDAFHDYGMSIFAGSPGWQQTSGWGNAKDLFWGPSEYYWHKIVNDPNDPNLIPQRGDVIIWGGTPSWGANPYGHIAVCLDADQNGVTVIQQDGFLQVPMYVARLKYEEPNAGNVIGWLRPNFDDDVIPAPVPEAAPAAANVRTTGPAGVRRREEPKLTGAERDTFPAGVDLTLAGYVRTDDPTYTYWVKGGLTGGWMWLGGFTDQSLDGLVDLTPPQQEALAAHQRITGADGAILRGAPDKNGSVVSTFLPDRILDFKGYVKGTAPYPNSTDVWFVGAVSGGYVWAGALTDSSTAGLANLTAAVVPEKVPAYDFELDFRVINGVVVEKLPAHITNVDVGNFPAFPRWNVFHWWGQPPIPFTSPLGEWARENSFKSPHFQVGDARIAQIVSLKDRAYHASTEGNSSVGIEVDPRICERDAAGQPTAVALAIRANLVELIRALAVKYAGQAPAKLHREVPGNNTSCSPIDLAWVYAPLTPSPAPVEPAPRPEPVEPQEPAPAPVPEVPGVEVRNTVLADFFARLLAWLTAVLYPKGK